jgi:putative ABC transport system substrate-binding protein
VHDLGYIEGQNIAIERRFADWKLDRLPELAADLVRRNVDVIVAVSTPRGRAAQQATRTIPIVVGGWPIRSVTGWSPVWRGRTAT